MTAEHAVYKAFKVMFCCLFLAHALGALLADVANRAVLRMRTRGNYEEINHEEINHSHSLGESENLTQSRAFHYVFVDYFVLL